MPLRVMEYNVEGSTIRHLLKSTFELMRHVPLHIEQNFKKFIYWIISYYSGFIVISLVIKFCRKIS